jgi:aspartate dehydrogenase
MKKIKIGIVGCGTIGSEIARACQSRLKDSVDVVGICDLSKEKAELLQRSLKSKTKILELDDLIKKADIIVEAAGAGISANILKKSINGKKDVLIMSIGGLLGNEGLLGKAEKSGIRVYLPSGALCGIDGLKSASIGRVDSVTLTTRKPPKGLVGAPYIVNNNIDLSSIKGEAVIFDGTALEAVKGFPQNVNVAAILSLAGLGAANTRVRIVTSPDYTMNIHEVEIKGESGNISTMTQNLPSKVNPKTSQLAVFSAIATLEGIVKSVRIGT